MGTHLQSSNAVLSKAKTVMTYADMNNADGIGFNQLLEVALNFPHLMFPTGELYQLSWKIDITSSYAEMLFCVAVEASFSPYTSRVASKHTTLVVCSYIANILSISEEMKKKKMQRMCSLDCCLAAKSFQPRPSFHLFIHWVLFLSFHA